MDTNGSSLCQGSELGRCAGSDDCPSKRGLGEYGCKHYRRRAKLVTPCCDEIFWCRHCHNEEKNQNESDYKKRHELNRRTITEVICAVCDARQPVGLQCCNCGVDFGAYGCAKCPFYDDDTTKEIYHCDDCGICRIGGRENYFHCTTCGSCYSIELQGNHKCIEQAMHQNCPVCFEFLFESVEPSTVLRCGHTIHTQCLRDLESKQSAVCPCCPICKHSLGDYSRYWEAIDAQIAQYPCPPEYAGWRVDILCNDCSTESMIPFHVIGHKCTNCGSYNTRRMGLHTDAVPEDHEDEAHEDASREDTPIESIRRRILTELGMSLMDHHTADEDDEEFEDIE